jgi:antirestriction protein ArdC
MSNTLAYEKITDQILDLMEKKNLAPWQKTWKGSNADSGALSMSSGKAYTGSNAWWLPMVAMGNSYTSRYWGTYKAIQINGGKVKKGQKGTTAIFWKFLEKINNNGKKETFPMLRHYTVFNADQAEWPDGIPKKFEPITATEEGLEFEPIDAAEAIVQGYISGPNGPTFAHDGGNTACYIPKKDKVSMPKKATFLGEAEYYSTVFHELGHSTGHPKRLARPGIVDTNYMGSQEYSEEELVAEFTACYLCGESGIIDTRENSAAYIKGWAKRMRADKKLLIRASGKAARASSYILRGADA